MLVSRDLARVETPKGVYTSPIRRDREGESAHPKPCPLCLPATLRDLTFPKQMHWDAWLDDGRGELVFGRPIRWILFLYGGRVVPFVIKRTDKPRSQQEVRVGSVGGRHLRASIVHQVWAARAGHQGPLVR